jgi:uncharacterized membrane protein YqjE
MSLAIAVPLSILVIAFAWLAYRPILGAGLILLALAVGYGLWRWHKPARPGTHRSRQSKLKNEIEADEHAQF